MHAAGATHLHGSPEPFLPFVSHLRDEAFTQLIPYLPTETITGAMRCVARLYAALPEKSALERNMVLVAYGGGKDSSYMLTFVRFLQLIIFRVYRSTFRLRVVTNRHAGMPRAVMENIHRCYQALRLFDDPDCELLLIDGNAVQPFRLDAPLPDVLARRNREDILMTGHRTLGDARPTFCNACNLGMVNAFGMAASYAGGVDLIVTGDSRREQRAYLVWVRRLAQQFGLEGKEAPERTGFKGFLGTMNSIAQTYFQDIHGRDAVSKVRERCVETRVRSGLQFFSIYDDTQYASGDHWDLLIKYLGFQFDDLAFSFTESDCGNPALMAHLRGLKCERVYGRSYHEGIAEYVGFALTLMQKKQFPPVLIAKMQERYTDPEAISRMRQVMNSFAGEAFGLTEEQLVCMIYSPFTEGGRNLSRWLQREQDGLAGREEEVHALLRQGAEALPGSEAAGLQADLEQASGLSLAQMRTLYARTLSSSSSEARPDLIRAILERDPHKDVIETRHHPDGPVVLEVLSGR